MSIRDKLQNLLYCPDLAIDLGTANTRLYALGRGLVCDEPSVVRLNKIELSAHGNNRQKPNAHHSINNCERCVTPISRGVVTDVEAAAALLEPLMRRVRATGLRKPRVLACAPSDATKAEVEALVAAVSRAGASRVKVTPEPLAAAVGAGVDISSPYAQMLIDIGDGVTDVAVIRSGGLIRTAALRSACRDIYGMIQSVVAKRYGVTLYRREAERLASEIGWEPEAPALVKTQAHGIDRAGGSEIEIEVEAGDVADAFHPVITQVRAMLRGFVRGLPHDVAAEVIESGVCLTGGGANMPGLKKMVAAETSLDVRISTDPQYAVIMGASRMLAVGGMTGLWDNDERH